MSHGASGKNDRALGQCRYKFKFKLGAAERSQAAFQSLVLVANLNVICCGKLTEDADFHLTLT